MIGCSSSDFAVAGAGDDTGATSDTPSSFDAKGDVDDAASVVDASVDSSTDAGPDGGPATATGCADLTREYLIDVAKLPNVAGCSGGWTLPGLGSDLAGGCAHVAGNDSANASGTGCHASDLCAVGWHVCADNVEFQLKSGLSKCPDVTAAKAFFASGQRSASAGVCLPDPPVGVSNDIFGCGTLGDATGSCGSLNRTMSTFTTDTASWSLGTDNDHERDNVAKGRLNGGVLCCSP